VNVSVLKFRSLLAAALALLLAASTAFAHHSTAMFDMQHTVTINGTVTQFDWTNPHTFIFMEVMSGGASENWSIEGMSPNYLSRNGWSRHTLKAGDKIGMEVHLLKDGRKGGFCATITLPDGKKLNNLPARPAGSPAPAAETPPPR
jgi:Family of unknown function (DUF6152)